MGLTGCKVPTEKRAIEESIAQEMDEVLDSRVPLQHQDQEDPLVIEYELNTRVHCVDWNEQSLAYGHELGVGILTRVTERSEKTSGLPFEFQRQWAFKTSYIHLGLAAENLRFNGQYVAASHSDYSISYIDLVKGEVTNLGGYRGHRSFVNGLDISYDGIVASTGVDRNLLIWEDVQQPPQLFRLSGSGLKVRFWDENDSDRLVVLEAGNKIRILDWRKRQWLLTIYPTTQDRSTPYGGNVKDIGVYNSEIIAIGEGWWKKFHIPSLTGGCGYTAPTDHGRLISDNSKNGMYNLSGRYIGYANTQESSIYDLVTASEHGSHVDIQLNQIASLALRERGDILAIASGTNISLVRNRAMNYEESLAE